MNSVNQESIMTPPTSRSEEALNASRPGIKTLLLIVGAVLLFLVIKFWAELKSVVGLG
jgi:hypothetical protein